MGLGGRVMVWSKIETYDYIGIDKFIYHTCN